MRLQKFSIQSSIISPVEQSSEHRFSKLILNVIHKAVRSRYKKLFLLCAAFMLFGIIPSLKVSAAQANVQSIVYGKSGKGQQLIYYKISPNHKTTKKMLLNFEIHGWEDAYHRDGQVLADYAKNLINYYKTHESALQNCTLYIIPKSNPDGLTYGYTNNGIGRCQASLGIDLNRSFDWNFVVRKNARNRTLNRPLLAPEAKSLANLVKSVRPNAVIDFHGWESMVIGSSDLSDVICKEFSVRHACDWSLGQRGFFAAWATKYASKTALVEYPPCAAYANQANSAYLQHTINAVNKVISKYYGDGAILKLENPKSGTIIKSGQNTITISGWSISMSGTKGIGVYLDGIYKGEAKTNGYRPDVARNYRGYTNASNSGFSIDLPIDLKSLSSGSHKITVKSTSNSATVLTASAVIIKAGQLYHIDEPLNYSSSNGDNIVVRGWAVNACGIKDVSILVGSNVYTANYGTERTDIDKYINSKKQYQDADKSGFCYTIASLPSGTYEIQVQITGNDGTVQTSKPLTIYVNSTTSSEVSAPPESSSSAPDSSSQTSSTAPVDNTSSTSSENK